jgi:hypothetical protein
MSEDKIKFVCENAEGKKYYLDGNQTGLLGNGALVNENGEEYPIEEYNRLIDFVYDEVNKYVSENEDDMTDDLLADNLDNLFEAAVIRFASDEVL